MLGINIRNFVRNNYRKYNARGSFSFSDDSAFGKMVKIFGFDMSLSVHVNNKKRYFNSL